MKWNDLFMWNLIELLGNMLFIMKCCSCAEKMQGFIVVDVLHAASCRYRT